MIRNTNKEQKLLLEEIKKQGVTNKWQIAYIMATAHHETNGTFKPVIEAYWVKDRLIRKHGKKRGLQRFYRWLSATSPMNRYYPYVGRGLVQITWERNYRFFSNVLTDMYRSNYIDLVENPGMAMIPEFSRKIIVYGMINGSFTGKKLSDYTNDNKVDLENARRIINGRDKAKKIAIIARRYYKSI
jgi:predicted chitinase